MRPFMPRSHALRAIYSPATQSTTVSQGASSRLFSQVARQNTLRPLQQRNRRPIQVFPVRYNSDSSASKNSLTDRRANPTTDAQNEEQNRLRREQEPAYEITFTCKPCGSRSVHRMSKHGYHKGTVLISCPSCSSRHVISDHLNIFFDKKTTLEDIIKEQGAKITRGYRDGDMEFWDDGSVTPKSDQGSKS